MGTLGRDGDPRRGRAAQEGMGSLDGELGWGWGSQAGMGAWVGMGIPGGDGDPRWGWGPWVGMGHPSGAGTSTQRPSLSSLQSSPPRGELHP